MRGRPEPTEDVLPQLWEVIDELKRITEGLAESLAAAKKGEPDAADD